MSKPVDIIWILQDTETNRVGQTYKGRSKLMTAFDAFIKAGFFVETTETKDAFGNDELRVRIIDKVKSEVFCSYIAYQVLLNA